MSSSAASPGIGKVNPTLYLEAVFRADADGQDKTTVFVLDEAPEIGSWLMSFVEHYLAKDGGPAQNKGIAPPPGGAIQDELINGGVILASQRPDGERALRLNPRQSIWLNVKVRRFRQPALYTPVTLHDEPQVAKWLLSCQLRDDKTAADLPASGSVVSRLWEIGVIVDEAPGPGICFPDAQGPADPDLELSIAVQDFAQAAGQDIPTPVREILGKHEPALPTNIALRWLQDAGTGLVFPSTSTARVEPQASNNATAESAAQRAAEWRQQRTETRQLLKEKRYAVLRNIFPAGQRDMLRHYVRELVARGYFPPLGDGQVELRTAIHNERTIASFHHGLALLLGDICDEPLMASYCYLGCYEAGAVLERHIDRPQCAYNLSVVFDMQGPEGEPDPWPIYLELDNKPVAVNLKIGDGLLYSGTELWHWREALPEGQRAIVCFFHFVAENFDGSLH